MNRINCIIRISIVLLFISCGVQAEPGQDCRYLLFNANSLDLSSQQGAVASFAAIKQRFEGVQGEKARVGLAAIFSYFRYDAGVIQERLRHLLWAARKTDMPVLVKLDGEQWWGNRPDLWNWWDPNRPGYDPANGQNVEWTCWDCSCAMKIAWRNWGRQIRVLPPPNLMSPAYRQASHEGMNLLLPIVKAWQQSLGADKAYLFVGINVGWESSIGINAYYYPDGNRYLDKPEADDPRGGIDRVEVLDRGLVQSGYAALTSAGIKTQGEITEDDLAEVVRRHLEDLAKYVYDYGFDRKKIFTHGVGNENGEKLYDAAVNDYSCPGWSDYWYADDPAKDKGIMRNLQRSDAPCWAAAEWLLHKDLQEKEAWKRAFVNTLGYPGCRFMCVYNWEGVSRPGSKVIAAAREALAALNALDPDKPEHSKHEVRVSK